MKKQGLLKIIAVAIFCILLIGQAFVPRQASPRLDREGVYTSKEEVSQYLITYQHLPKNYLTKKQAIALGWKDEEGNLWKVAQGMSIGGDIFYNREGKLPKGNGIVYYEADIDYQGGYRNGKRLIFSNQGKIYYTHDHYKTFKELY